MLLSKSCEYGVRASAFLSMRNEGEFVPIREISDKLDISFHFLTKILQTLTHAGLVLSFKGPKGGVCLAKPSADITLLEIIIAIDGFKLFSECVLGLPGCGHQKPCPLHDKWAYNRDALKLMFESTTMEDVANKVRKLNLRLSDSHKVLTLTGR